MNVYATADQIKSYNRGKQFRSGQASDDDDLIKSFCIRASRVFDTFVTNGVVIPRVFYPRVMTKTYDYPEDDNTLLRLRDDLLELQTLTTKNGDKTVNSSEYVLRGPSGTYGMTPYDRIQLLETGSITAFEYINTAYSSQSVTGIWGYHDDWANAWQDSGDEVEDNPLTDVATEITVNDADGDDINGFSLRFQVQQLLRIGSEYLWLTGINTDDQKLTVRRGMNGTTAAEHAQNTTIYVYQPMAQIVRATELLSTYMYQSKDTAGSKDARPIVTSQGVIMPASLPDEVTDILMHYQKEAL